MNEFAVLGLDLGTSTGWALRDRAGRVTSGAQRFDLSRGESPGMRFLRFRRWLAELLVERRVTDLPCGGERHAIGPAVVVVGYERPHHRGGAATAVANGLQAIVQEEAARLGIELAPVHSATLKKHATGRGNAKKPDMVAAAARRWGLERRVPGLAPEVTERPVAEVLGEDEADALCVLAWTLAEVGAR